MQICIAWLEDYRKANVKTKDKEVKEILNRTEKLPNDTLVRIWSVTGAGGKQWLQWNIVT
jgi:hypothetical protein